MYVMASLVRPFERSTGTDSRELRQGNASPELPRAVRRENKLGKIGSRAIYEQMRTSNVPGDGDEGGLALISYVNVDRTIQIPVPWETRPGLVDCI